MAALAVRLLCALALLGATSPRDTCRYQDVLDYLNLSKSNELFTSVRPVKDWRRPTKVQMSILPYAILSVNEKYQLFSALINNRLAWQNEFISWDPEEFCGIKKFTVPKTMLWKPDLEITENTGTDKGKYKNPYLIITHTGLVVMLESFKVMSTCKMDVHRFPFDLQTCNITILSYIYTDAQLLLEPYYNSSILTQESTEHIYSQGDWDLVGMFVNEKNGSIDDQQWDELVYTITIRRRPLLYTINFLLPVLFLLTLDIASFFISGHRGEKLGFKVTVLLTISFMLLLLNNILPSTSNRTPLIAIYCIVVLAFMWLSILETILVTFLMDQDTVSENAAVAKRQTCSCHGVVNGCCPQSTWSDAELVLQIVTELQTLQRCWLPRPEGRWERVARHVDNVFFCFYLLGAILFLLFISLHWVE